MFTVLIAEKEHIDAIRRDNALFFEPFLNNRELAFCRWIPGGETLDEAVPDLTDAEKNALAKFVAQYVASFKRRQK